MSSPSSTPKSESPDIRISKLSYTYDGNQRPTLLDLSFEIFPGEFVIIAGPSGSGKSTFARCLTGFIPHEYPGDFQGSITIRNKETKSHTIRDFTRTVSLIQQDPDSQLVTLNVTDEVAFGLENFQTPSNDLRLLIDWALNAANANDLKIRSTHSLSGGEKQKVIIASFIGLKSPILILDEPTARLDPQTSNEVLDTLHELNKQGATILVIEHRIQPFLSLASRVILMNKGQISFDGAPDQLATNPSILKNLGLSLISSDFLQDVPSNEISTQQLAKISNLTFTYPRIEEQIQPQPALQDLSFSLHTGEIVALMGANGSGKSTLLLHLMGLLTPDAGTIHLKQQNIHEQPVSQLARNVGFIFQNPLHQLFTPTVKDEVLLASKHLGFPESHETQHRAEKLLDEFDLLIYKDQSPFTLSLGEQRRLTIASVLLHKPPLLLLDEPFIGQDYHNVHRLMKVLQKEVSQGTTVLLATHDSSIAETYCSRLLFLYNGRLLIDSPVKQGLEYLAVLEQSSYDSASKPFEVNSEI